jgi:hypothetical protein
MAGLLSRVCPGGTKHGAVDSLGDQIRRDGRSGGGGDHRWRDRPNDKILEVKYDLKVETDDEEAVL